MHESVNDGVNVQPEEVLLRLLIEGGVYPTVVARDEKSRGQDEGLLSPSSNLVAWWSSRVEER